MHFQRSPFSTIERITVNDAYKLLANAPRSPFECWEGALMMQLTSTSISNPLDPNSRKRTNLEEYTRLKLAVSDMSKKLQRINTHDILLDRLWTLPDLCTANSRLPNHHHKSPARCHPFKPHQIIKGVEYQLNSEGHELRTLSQRRAKGTRSEILHLDWWRKIFCRVTDPR
jgi:hypothetical protein